MKNLFLIIFLSLILISSTRAQYFITITKDRGNIENYINIGNTIGNTNLITLWTIGNNNKVDIFITGSPQDAFKAIQSFLLLDNFSFYFFKYTKSNEREYQKLSVAIPPGTDGRLATDNIFESLDIVNNKIKSGWVLWKIEIGKPKAR